jgi:hypothetical protein
MVLQFLAFALADLSDPRRARTVRYPLAAILTMTFSALLAIAERGARQFVNHQRTLGFPEVTTPCQTTLQRLFCELDSPKLSRRSSLCYQVASEPYIDHSLQGVVIDGKTRRSRLRFTADGPVHDLSVLFHETGTV